MLLNNMCESFNNVLKQARDKPILTQMEWMRRYVMQRNCQKREVVHSVPGRFMPYVKKQFDWAGKIRKFNNLTRSSEHFFEVENNSERFLVNLEDKKCTCFSWELTGIPCHHAYACILYMRADPEDYVHDFYSKKRYMDAYEPVLLPMPGPKEWEKTPFPEPVPAPFRKMSGRPSKRKRTKELGEEAEKVAEVVEAVIRLGGKANRCSNCRQYAHNKGVARIPLSHLLQLIILLARLLLLIQQPHNYVPFPFPHHTIQSICIPSYWYQHRNRDTQ
ncbi:uncharacterized protein [Spinacia oleracea]|uniref:SWIM-type domain-containing protein n=1 Tax=Spinacia oleracea TaxID=3562 RepID=A0ABM3R7M2_SPIOL|nr:uncharacterized protein LOC130467204 [Spinacia oleracea]